ncbi:MAG: hypothetical protein RMK19_08255 [Bacteroidia bacterium]|nr:hypothetical protein [Bacteroidia bacterium]MDW8015989.1 hypothetical protein [Bacteroidia bacterium]
MIGIALLVGFILLYKAYKLTLAHSQRLSHLETENQYLKQELQRLQEEYEALLESRSKSPDFEESPAEYLQRIASRLEGRKNPLL